jgi:hypothetical protein
MDTDLRNTKARLGRLALAAACGAVLTFFTLEAMLSSGRGPNHDRSAPRSRRCSRSSSSS